jgi:hypothetical protein
MFRKPSTVHQTTSTTPNELGSLSGKQLLWSNFPCGRSRYTRSSPFYHFNVDVDGEFYILHLLRLFNTLLVTEFVTTDGNVRPTRENSRPVVDRNYCNTGSFVFFNQSSMRQGGDTTAEAKRNIRHSGKADSGQSIQEAFERYLVLQPIDRDSVW